MNSTRRQWLAATGSALAQNSDDAWGRIANQFPVDRSIVNMNHAGVGTTPLPVLDRVIELTRQGERCAPNTIFSYAPQLEPIRSGLAAMLGASTEEIAITRNATESLQAVLLGIPLEKGDEVITTTLDYWAMLDALYQRRDRDGVAVKTIRIPAPCDDLSQIVRLFEQAITPRTRLFLISHPINLNGQLFPVRALSRLAHSRGIEVAVDAAQSFALKQYKLEDLECDYLGASLHKWLQAPKGTGVLYMRRQHIAKVWPLFASGTTRNRDDIRKFELYGTWPETILGIGAALRFHDAIGAAAKESHHRRLTSYWLDQVKDIQRLRIHTPAGTDQSCGITCVCLDKMPASRLRQWLYERHSIVTMDVTRRTREFDGIRISPGLPTTRGELDRLVAALHEAAKL
jgi:isopenicillin-N epimerase